MHRTKSILAALAAVALSATAVFAAGGLTSPAASDGLARAAAASGKTVPVGPDATADTHASKATESPEATEATETLKAAKSPDVDTTTGTTTPHPDNHGKTVSEAAQAETPSTFTNHGAYVSSIAKQNHGQGTSPIRVPVKVTKPTPTPTATAH